MKGNKEILELLIKSKADTNGEDKQSRTPLSYCLDFVSKDDNKYFDIAYQLIFEYHCDAIKKGRTTNRTFLHCCAARGDLETCKKLVEELGVSVIESDNMGYTAANYARKAGHNTTADYLQAHERGGCCAIL
ncbi:ankyrin repeat protein [Reticulomyxa filosa]|uniref:Ankyrin repeat protein n=1 Tax=Reticulomyxa filosa TaxID=46433 RepID=X6N9R5_RETFI|nr:ankyrin repeat protein [Reticulomyxa filosa]|eukprot:ETO22658.1 ankyrin repeat protein [Reticulomyxa filosa]